MKKTRILGAATILSLGIATIVPVQAAIIDDADTQDTTVTYINEEVINGDASVWGVIVPTAVTFTNTVTTGDLSVELVGINGYALSDLGNDLVVYVNAKSANGYLLKNGSTTVDYSVNYAAYGVKEALTLDKTATGTTKTEVAQLTKTLPKRQGTATLGTKPTTKGAYADVITYTIGHTGSNSQ